jgi:hypothetical protein
MSFGRLTAAALSGTIDTTVALASLNFDFSLIKVEARKEYKDFGMQLSKQRSDEAENGLTHVTARKLGALFADIIPPCPHLISAYGLRVSEIAKSSTHNPKGTKIDGIFADQLGADGTSIWAAATSGDPAIGVHLLACMLARMWTAPKAVSIWVELILERKKELLGPGNQDSTNPFSMTASQISVSRDQLAKWDSSARAWLQIADAAKQLPQKQLMLIVNNISTAVNEKPAVYESVVLAWKTAMTTVEKLVLGASQSIQGGAPLLGLSSWHLYPDMVVLGHGTKEVKQADELIPIGTLVTVGLQDRTAKNRGVFWSLPLAHLRFYGDPVVAKSSTFGEFGLDIEQLLQVALGSFLGQWVSKFADFETAARVLVLMGDIVPNKSPHVREGQTQFSLSQVNQPYAIHRVSLTWLKLLANAAQAYLTSTGLVRVEYMQLMKAGRRRYPNFIAEIPVLPPFLGLKIPKTLLSLVRDDEERIWVLRNVALKYGEIGYRMIIQYQSHGLRISSTLECATALPRRAQHRGQKRTRDGAESTHSKHVRWICGEIGENDDRCKEISDLGEEPVVVSHASFMACVSSREGLRWSSVPSWFRETTQVYMPENEPYHMLRTHLYDGVPAQLDFIIGDPNVAALYALSEDDVEASKFFTSQEVEYSLSKDCILPRAFEQHINGLYSFDERSAVAIHSLKALGTVVDVYKHLPDARIAIKVADTPLYRAKWVPRMALHYVNGLASFELDYPRTFACIARFESGCLDVDPASLEFVMAMSSGNSIFIASSLLLDPSESSVDCKVKRIVGNVGRPGLAMMTAPQRPKMRTLDHDTWNHINHNGFDGKAENSFQHTTLHLSFTEWEMPIDAGEYGLRDREVFFLEAPISIHHRGEWIADIDIIKMFSADKFMVLPASVCVGHRGVRSQDITKEIVAQEFVTIDSWDELLDTPLEPAVIRAVGNWQARLAAAALSVQREHETRIVPPIFCWSCYFREGANWVVKDRQEELKRIASDDYRNEDTTQTSSESSGEESVSDWSDYSVEGFSSAGSNVDESEGGAILELDGPQRDKDAPNHGKMLASEALRSEKKAARGLIYIM